MVGDNGITQNIKEAKYIIAVKSYGDSLFERLEYKLNYPLVRRISYKDSKLTVKHGHFADYTLDGFINSEGDYVDDKKEGTWYLYGDSAKITFRNKYKGGLLIEEIDMDSLGKTLPRKELDPQEVEATYQGGEKAFSGQIQKKVSAAYDNDKITRGGHVRIRFAINTKGIMENFYLTQSTEFLFDEACLVIMKSIPGNWNVATDHGKLVKAYREQPISFDIK